ncbi:hypothetical protein LJC64_03280, partial [Ruminococcaceae bacterium OttesenSCG-928-A11]|nr:hypothetical protein [Ruminococcaceae bacterium OttesenSCG-928-A11]
IPVINEVGAPVKSSANNNNQPRPTQPLRPNSTIRRPMPNSVKPVVKSPKEISFKRKAQGPSAGGLWSK